MQTQFTWPDSTSAKKKKQRTTFLLQNGLRNGRAKGLFTNDIMLFLRIFYPTPPVTENGPYMTHICMDRVALLDPPSR